MKTIAHNRMTGGQVAMVTTFNGLQVGGLQGSALIGAMKAAGDKPGAEIVMINGATSGYEAKQY